MGASGKLFDSSVAENPHVDGLAIRTTWRAVEPLEGEYDWSFLDAATEQARSLGKKASLSVTAGNATPTWVFQAGAQSFTFVDSNPYGEATFCTEVTIPVPYDQVFLNKWKSFIQAVGARYDSNPSIKRVRISGINKLTAETILPHSLGEPIPNCDTSSNDIQNWINAGYTAALIKETWIDIATTFQSAFPRQSFSAVLTPNGLPKINDSGQYDATLRLAEDILKLGVARLGAIFIPENNSLSVAGVYGLIKGAAVNSVTGFQMLWFVTGDTTYRMNNGVPGDPQMILRSAIDNGINAGASYLEIYPADISNPDFQDILSHGHQRINQ